MGLPVLTPAGVGSLDHPHPLQEAFADLGAVQCGYCTGGLIIAAKALLDQNLAPTEEEIKEAISGNLCRCTGYGPIVEAVKVAAEKLRERGAGLRGRHAMTVTVKPLPPVDLPELKVIGKPLRRVDALGKAVGATVYAGDFSMPGMLHAKVFRSGEASARITRLDVSKARALPGVVCVLTSGDLPNARLVTDMPGQTGQAQRKGSDAPVLAIDNVRFVGEPVALIAAETESIAEAALRLIEIEYEPTPGIFDPEDGLKPGAPILHEPDNKVGKWKIRKGDLERGFAEADLVVENTFRVPYQDHAYIEPEAGVGWLDSQGVINLRVSTQVIEHFRSVAKALGVPQNKIRVQGTFVGGGFGGKEDITVEIFLALLVQATGRPIRLVYTREESILAHSKRHPMVITHRTGVRRRRQDYCLAYPGGGGFGSISLPEPLRPALLGHHGARAVCDRQRAGRCGSSGDQ